MPTRDPETGRFISGQTDSHEEDTQQAAPSIAEVEPEAPIEDHPGDPVEDDYPDEEDYEDEDESPICTVCDSEAAGYDLHSELEEDAVMCQSCYEDYYSCDICEREAEMHNTTNAWVYVTGSPISRTQVRICDICCEGRTQRHPGYLSLEIIPMDCWGGRTANVLSVGPNNRRQYILSNNSQIAEAQLRDIPQSIMREATLEVRRIDGGDSQTRPTVVRIPEMGQCENACGSTEEEFLRGRNNICATCLEKSLCIECREIGVPACTRCMKNKIIQAEKTETTLRVQRIKVDNYHPREHAKFKQTKYRMKKEHPYLYYGVEIEVELPSTVSRREFAETVVMGTEGMFVAERDGSLRNGVEFISRPTSYARWSDKETIKRLDRMFEIFEEWGVKKVKQDTAGMHIHMSKKFFQKTKGKTEKQQIDDMAWVFELYDQEVEAFSRRRFNQYCRTKKSLAKKMISSSRLMTNNFDITLRKDGIVKSMGSGDSHHHIIAETAQTVELRSFKTPESTLQLMGAIEFSRNIAHFCRKYQPEGLNLKQILSSKESPFLDAYMEQQKLDFSSSKPFENHITVIGSNDDVF